MKTMDFNVSAFRELFHSFFERCETLSDIKGVWNEEENGKMGAYYENIFLSLILRLIAKDGKIQGEEIDYLNRCFFEYSINYDEETLLMIYKNSSDFLSSSFIQWLIDSSNLLVYEKMKRDYIELVQLICAIIIQSDGEVTKDEIEEAKLIMNSVRM